ncbi:HPF/RaiA family ribosome-associated protein [Variovorax sp. RT4R15]|uniref:HPF/RaiA family ribosome-associated protein n=1 Tax=Variovorax sp. RT4R15 TaxID=3443737 RepID=UPI003F44B044
MQIQVNASNGIENKEALERWADAEIKDNLSRFVEDVTRVEVHLSDETTGKSGGGDKRCTMEARLAHHQPVAVTHDAPMLDEAFRGAAGKLKRLIEHTLAKLDHKRDRESIRKGVDVIPE